MKILLDECIDHRFRFEFVEYDVKTVSFMEWDSLQNGALLKKAEQEFDVFITVDANIRFQQNFKNLNLAILLPNALKPPAYPFDPLKGYLRDHNYTYFGAPY